MSDPLKITSARVLGLLDQFDHEVTFSFDSKFVIVYGPNGVGKTKFLEIIDSLTRLLYGNLFDIPFSVAAIRYTDGKELSVVRKIGKPERSEAQQVILEFKLTQFDKLISTWEADSNFLRATEAWLRAETPYQPYIGSTWIDPRDGEMVEFKDLENRYSDRGLVSVVGQQLVAIPDELSSFCNQLHSKLIETQRLKIENPHTNLSRVPDRRGPRITSAILDYSTSMKKMLLEALTANSRVAQQLDRTFPQRMLTATPRPGITEKDIREKYDKQSEFRSRLSEISLIGLQRELELPKRPLEKFEVNMLDLHLEDVDKKLKSFEVLLRKIGLFENIINARLIGKKIRIDAQSGITITRETNKVPIPVDALSSGEQHEIILMFDLLFNVKAGSLVLIDEPEISLHVSWQLKFISDVEKISELSNFQFIVATHSPQIINDRINQMARFGPDEYM